MAWTAPRTFVPGELETAAIFNTHLRDNMAYLKGQAGAVYIENVVGVQDSTPTSDWTAQSYYVTVGAGAATTTAAVAMKGSRGSDTTPVAFFAGVNLLATGSDKRAGQVAFHRDTDSDSGSVVISTRSSGTLAEKMRVSKDGRVGINRTVPQGLIHSYDSISGFLKYEFDALAGTAQTVIPDGAGDVLYGVQLSSLVRGSGGVVQTLNSGGTVLAPSSNTAIYSNGADIVQFQIAANGACTVQRTGGSLTYKVSLFLQWL